MTPAQVAGLICTAAVDEEVARVRTIMRRGEELAVPEMARTLALDTALDVELALRLLAQAAGRPVEDPELHY
jgi:hypothetical protein